MPTEPVSADSERPTPSQAAPALPRVAEWPIMGVVCAALSGLWIADGIVVWSGDPSARQITIWVGLLAVASLTTLAITVSRLLSSAQSRQRHVFCSRRVLAVGAFLSVLTVAVIGSIVRRDPFREVLSRGQITAAEIVDVGLILAAFSCLTGAAIAFTGAWEAYRDERAWSVSR